MVLSFDTKKQMTLSYLNFNDVILQKKENYWLKDKLNNIMISDEFQHAFTAFTIS